MKAVDTFTATIYVGLVEVKHQRGHFGLGYEGLTHPISVVEDEIQKYVDDVDLCITVTPTRFFYKTGSEPGVIVSLINHPRFPSPRGLIEKHATALAWRLMKATRQMRVSIVYPDNTVMLEAGDLKEQTA